MFALCKKVIVKKKSYRVNSCNSKTCAGLAIPSLANSVNIFLNGNELFAMFEK